MFWKFNVAHQAKVQTCEINQSKLGLNSLKMTGAAYKPACQERGRRKWGGQRKELFAVKQLFLQVAQNDRDYLGSWFEIWTQPQKALMFAPTAFIWLFAPSDCVTVKLKWVVCVAAVRCELSVRSVSPHLTYRNPHDIQPPASHSITRYSHMFHILKW